jgi:hypothetical protein
MKPRHVEEPAPPDPRFDPYRRGAARAFEGGEHIGFLATRVSVFWRVEGRPWSRRLVAPIEGPEWELVFTDPNRANGPGQDRVAGSTDQAEEMLAEWRDGYVQVNGHTYTLEWLSREEADATSLAPEYWD